LKRAYRQPIVFDGEAKEVVLVAAGAADGAAAKRIAVTEPTSSRRAMSTGSLRLETAALISCYGPSRLRVP
jgi:hypothetical protein